MNYVTLNHVLTRSVLVQDLRDVETSSVWQTSKVYAHNCG